MHWVPNSLSRPIKSVELLLITVISPLERTMASPVAAEEHSNAKSEEGTTAFQKKRSRRVSFAENTSVHIFDRDEEIETPPDPDAPRSSPSEDLGFSDRDDEPKQFFGNEEEDDEDEDMDELGSRSPFFRLVRSPSSGGSTIGSATSNDEDNFFGPVSAKFIRQDLSDSTDEIHDQTMDSTAFSMHFNSIARSDSERYFKTPTGIHLFEEKTPTSSMLLTLDKNPNYQPDVSISKSTTDSQSNDMSLVGEYHDKYNYGKLSPASDPHNDLHVVSNILDGVTVSLSKSPGTMTPNNQSTFFLTTESQKHGGSFSVSSLQKSISRLKILEASPFSPALNAKLEDSYNSFSISNMSPLVTFDNNNKFLQANIGTKTLDTYFEGTLPSSVQKMRENASTNMVDENKVLQNDGIDPSPVENVQSSSVNQLVTRKRKTEDMMTEKIARIKSSSRFFKETELLPDSVDKMNLHAIDRMVDILEKLQRSKTYELLSNEIKSQKVLDPSSSNREKRLAETRLLLCKIVHEKAKLQLMHVKREKLLKNKQSLEFGIQESEALKLKYSPKNLLNAQVIHNHPFSNTTKDIEQCQVDCEKVSLLKQEIEDTDRKFSNFIKSFHASCKMKEEADPVDTIAFVKNHLMKRARCQIIRKDFQLWVIEDVKSSKDHHYVVLNYLDLMTQRFTVTPGVITSISVSNTLNETNILKNFKDMDALTAFQFVFTTGSTQKHVADTNLAHETQKTSSLLGNLVDVIEEIQLARIELKNFIHARFHTSFDEHLHLELYFFDSITRKKATVTLNASCLKRGIYPSEILPCQINIQSQNPSSSSLSTEISTAIKNLTVGFSMILRLSKCISHVVTR